MFFIAVLTVNIMIHVASIYRSSDIQEVLAASYETPWGIVTSLFVHSDVSHLLNNMTTLFLFLMLLLSSNIFLSKDELKSRIRNSFIIIFIVPMILNLFWIFLYRDVKILGSSGIVYTLEGMCFGFSFLNALEIRRLDSDPQRKNSELFFSLLFNIAVFVGFSLSLLISPTGFLGSTHDEIIRFHGISFSGGFIVAMLHSILTRYRKGNKNYTP